MRRIGKSWWMAAVAACGTTLPAPLLAQDRPVAKKPAEAAAEPAAKADKPEGTKIRDVALSEDGAFAGRVIDDHGKPLDGVVVTLFKADKEVGSSTADAQGRFKFASLKGGVYQVRTPQSQTTYRLWSHDVAPQQAAKTVVVNASTPVVRGQLGFADPLTLATVGLGVAGVTLGGIAVHKLNKLDDKIDNTPTSP